MDITQEMRLANGAVAVEKEEQVKVFFACLENLLQQAGVDAIYADKNDLTVEVDNVRYILHYTAGFLPGSMEGRKTLTVYKRVTSDFKFRDEEA